jgi:hypothetical protein
MVSLCFGQTKQALPHVNEAGTNTTEDDVNRLIFVTAITDSTYSEQIITYLHLNKFLCKGQSINIFIEQQGKTLTTNTVPIIPKKEHKPLFTIHGNILYNFSYRSIVDTPFAQNDVQQHLTQTNFDVIVKQQIPIKIILTNRNSTSPYIRNNTEVKFQFNQRQYQQQIKQKLTNIIDSNIDYSQITQAENLYKANLQKAYLLESWINNPMRLQQIIQEKEAQLQNTQLSAVGNLSTKLLSSNTNDLSLPDELFKQKSKFNLNKIPVINKIADSLNVIKSTINNKVNLSSAETFTNNLKDKATTSLDSIAKSKVKDSTFLEKYNTAKATYEKLIDTVKKQQQKLVQSKKQLQDSIAKIKSTINGLSSKEELLKEAKKNKKFSEALSKTEKLLLAIKQFGIGRNWIDYSELSVKNISLSGVNIEATSKKYYVAFATGRVNYRFRDFIFKNNELSAPQTLSVVRFGVGEKQRNNVIFTYYQGKKNVLNPTGLNATDQMQKISGFTVESRWQLNPNNFIVAEFAKSSFANNRFTQNNNPPKNTFNFNTRTNEAYSIKLFSNNQQTNTKIEGYYKQIGENFQSFSLNPLNTNQNAWMIKVNQLFFKKKLVLDAAIRKNDFNSPVAFANTFTSSTIFKSIQVSLRIPKYPFVSVGYFPSSQLSMANNNTLMESQFNTLNVVASHSYFINKLAMNTNGMFTKFYNTSSDTGFLYYNASNYTLSHTIYFPKFSLQSTGAYIDQSDFKMFSVDATINYQCKNWLTLGGGLKINKLNNQDVFLTENVAIGVVVKKLGTIQINYDKSYLPNTNRQLVPVDIGRCTFYREF